MSYNFNNSFFYFFMRAIANFCICEQESEIRISLSGWEIVPLGKNMGTVFCSSGDTGFEGTENSAAFEDCSRKRN